MKILSIVTASYNSAQYIKDFCQKTEIQILSITDNYEIIIVDDGSKDDCVEKIKEEILRNQNIKLIKLSRNFGQHKALIAGLKYSKGNYAFILDIDLEEPIDMLPYFYNKIIKNNVDVVYGVQEKRKGKYLEKILGYIFYKLFNLMCGIKIPPNLVTMRIMSRRYVNSLMEFKERNLFLAGIFELNGFASSPVSINKISKGYSSYNFTKKLRMCLIAITSFSSKPLEYISILGFLITFISIIFGIVVFYRKITGYSVEIGWTSLVISIFFMGGIIVFLLGIISIYLARIHDEVKNRPNAIIENIY